MEGELYSVAIGVYSGRGSSGSSCASICSSPSWDCWRLRPSMEQEMKLARTVTLLRGSRCLGLVVDRFLHLDRQRANLVDFGSSV